MSGGWVGSTRSSRLPHNWASDIVPRILTRDHRICWLCGGPGADAVDHKQRGDDHSDANLAAAHDKTWPHCHRKKSSAEGNAARPRERREPEPHPGLL